MSRSLWNALLGAVFVAGLAPASGGARAEDAATVACEIIRTTGDFENLKPNFRASGGQREPAAQVVRYVDIAALRRQAAEELKLSMLCRSAQRRQRLWLSQP